MRFKDSPYRTEETYIQWIRRYILFHNKQHPSEISIPEIESLISTAIALQAKALPVVVGQRTLGHPGVAPATASKHLANTHRKLDVTVEQRRSPQPSKNSADSIHDFAARPGSFRRFCQTIGFVQFPERAIETCEI
ncbi:MAG: hypothetical protein HC771_21870 [Synechococcales cyanobacterium CRU_2_2]|nr:hypothetical protein [Synechococcales cyanobacterium CRU_2_2]